MDQFPTAQNVLLKTQIAQLSQKLMELPNQITEQQTKLLEMHDVASKTQARIETIESDIMAEIASERVAEDKKKYPNEQGRSAELKSRLNINDNFKLYKEDQEKMDKNVAKAKIELQRLENEFKAIKSIAYMVGAAYAI